MSAMETSASMSAATSADSPAPAPSGAAAATGSPGAAAPASSGQSGFAVPHGYRLVEASEYDTTRRAADNAKGYEPWYRAANKHGFKDPADLDKWSPVFQKWKDPTRLTSIFEPEAPAQGQAPSQPPQGDYMTKAEFEKWQATSTHKAGLQSEQAAVSRYVKEHLGEGASALDVRLATAFVQQELLGVLKPYPDGHPLAGDWTPGTEEDIKGVLGQYAELRKTAQATGMVETGRAANATKPAAPTAGRSGGQGAPGQNEHKGSDPTDEQMLADLKARQELRRGAKPIGT